MENWKELIVMQSNSEVQSNDDLREVIKNMGEWRKYLRTQLIGFQRESKNPKNLDKEETERQVKSLQELDE